MRCDRRGCKEPRLRGIKTQWIASYRSLAKKVSELSMLVWFLVLDESFRARALYSCRSNLSNHLWKPISLSSSPELCWDETRRYETRCVRMLSIIFREWDGTVWHWDWLDWIGLDSFFILCCRAPPCVFYTKFGNRHAFYLSTREVIESNRIEQDRNLVFLLSHSSMHVWSGSNVWKEDITYGTTSKVSINM